MNKVGIYPGTFDPITKGHIDVIKKSLNIVNKLIIAVSNDFSKNYLIAIATNAVKDTLNICLKKLKINEFIDYKICNADIANPKPNPEIYLKILIKFGLYPKQALILEDSYVGRAAAKNSGGHLMAIKKLNDVSIKNIKSKIKKISYVSKSNKKISWDDEKLNIVIPMAGEGKRFKQAGYIFPKPIIDLGFSI